MEIEKRLVPLSKVIGTSRGTVGQSVFENVRHMEDGEREPSRFQSCFSFSNKMTLEELRESYKNVAPVDMDYYMEEDEYYLSNEGNHRTLTAMLLGAEFINTNVTIKHCNFEKRDKCLAADKFYDNYGIVQINQTYFNRIEILFKGKNDIYAVEGFQIRREENCFEYISLLSKEIEKDFEYVKKLRRLPTIIRNIVLKCCKNKRIMQYFHKMKGTRSYYSNVRIYEY